VKGSSRSELLYLSLLAKSALGRPLAKLYCWAWHALTSGQKVFIPIHSKRIVISIYLERASSERLQKLDAHWLVSGCHGGDTALDRVLFLNTETLYSLLGLLCGASAIESDGGLTWICYR